MTRNAEVLAPCGVDRIVTSTVPRAAESGAILGAGLSLSPVPDDGFDELKPGDLSRIPVEDLERTIVHAYRNASQKDARFFGGEAFAAFATRVDRALARLWVDPDWTTAAIVSHDPVNRLLLANSLGLGLAGLAAFEQDAGCINIIDFSEDDAPPIVRLVNATWEDPAKSGSRETGLTRFYRSYRASRGGAAG